MTKAIFQIGKNRFLIIFFSSIFHLDFIIGISWNGVNLPEEHLALHFKNNPTHAIKCLEDESCPFKQHTNRTTCWSYEEDCSYHQSHSYSKPVCPDDHKGWVATKAEQVESFFNQADFGFVKEQRQQLKSFCSPLLNGDAQLSSSLECSEHLKFCRGRNIFLDLRHLAHRATPVRYHMDVLRPGDVGGYCRLDAALLSRHSDQISPLQSWGPELRYFTATQHPPDTWQCDVWYDRPVILAKIDAAVSLYHHFCDFFNLYMSQHVNNSDPHAFSTDVQVLIWESYPYRSSFEDAWRAITHHSLQNLADVAGKRLCFREVMFPLLPRQIFGLYYNTPIIWGCERSGLFRAFNRHMLHRLKVPSRDSLVPAVTAGPGTDFIRGTALGGDGMVHVTLLSRQTQHRRILNQDALVKAVRKKRKDVKLTVATFDHGQSFLGQLRLITGTDVLVGLHGAGLTHLLFLPDWGQLFELYNCGDEHCYKDLARLRGVPYYTWRAADKMQAEDEGHHPQLGAHEKFTNYQFDVDEFLSILDEAVSAVKEHPKWIEYQLRGEVGSTERGGMQAKSASDHIGEIITSGTEPTKCNGKLTQERDGNVRCQDDEEVKGIDMNDKVPNDLNTGKSKQEL